MRQSNEPHGAGGLCRSPVGDDVLAQDDGRKPHSGDHGDVYDISRKGPRSLGLFASARGTTPTLPTSGSACALDTFLGPRRLGWAPSPLVAIQRLEANPSAKLLPRRIVKVRGRRSSFARAKVPPGANGGMDPVGARLKLGWQLAFPVYDLGWPVTRGSCTLVTA